MCCFLRRTGRRGVCFVALLSLLAAPRVEAAGQDVSDDIFYHFMPIAWRDSDEDPYRFGDFGGMTASLDYLQDLGITAIWMNPIFPSPAYHGYQHGRADELNGWLGSESEFLAFVAAAHDRGMRVFVDLVSYGISHDSPWYLDAFGNPSSIYDDWLAFEDSGNTSYLGGSYQTWNGQPVGFIHWDLRNPLVVDLVTSWATKWLDPNGDGDPSDGIDGYRLDHVWQYYPSGPEGWGYNIDSFWIPWRQALRAVNPDVFVFAEQAQWSSYGTELLTGLDAAFTKPFEFAAREALATERATPLYGSMAGTVAALGPAPDGTTVLCTIGNHDVSRLATVIGDDFEKGKAAAAVLMTQPFPPVLYYGDEIGMRGAKDPGLGSDASDIPMREPMKWWAAAAAPMSNYYELNGPAYAARISRDFDGRSVQEQSGVLGSLLEGYRELIGLRHANLALRRGQYRPVPNSTDAVWSFVREHEQQQVLVLINLSGSPVNAVLDFESFAIDSGSTTPVSLRDGSTRPPLTEAVQRAYTVGLPAYGYDLLEVGLRAVVGPADVIDGQALHGRVLAVQDTPTSMGDNVNELDVFSVREDGDDLLIGLSGNLGPVGTGLALFFDAQPGGQNVLDMSGIVPPPNGPEALGGLRFDAGFEPDGFIYVNLYNGNVYVDQYTLLDGGGAGKIYRGQGFVDSATGVLSGGENPNGMEIAVDSGNRVGVTELDASLASTADRGIEMRLPSSDLGLDPSSSTVRFAAFLIYADGFVGNQWLPGLQGWLGLLGFAPDLRAIPGTQHVTLDLSGGPVAAPIEGVPELEISVRGAGSISFSLPRAGHARMSIYDVRGRRVQTLLDEPRAGGPQRLRWDGKAASGAEVASGVYFVRLEWGQQVRTARFVHLH